MLATRLATTFGKARGASSGQVDVLCEALGLPKASAIHEAKVEWLTNSAAAVLSTIQACYGTEAEILCTELTNFSMIGVGAGALLEYDLIRCVTVATCSKCVLSDTGVMPILTQDPGKAGLVSKVRGCSTAQEIAQCQLDESELSKIPSQNPDSVEKK
jgi:hypothetical protein